MIDVRDDARVSGSPGHATLYPMSLSIGVFTAPVVSSRAASANHGFCDDNVVILLQGTTTGTTSNAANVIIRVSSNSVVDGRIRVASASPNQTMPIWWQCNGHLAESTSCLSPPSLPSL
ncbi:Hypothetical protein, putative [Bodo saltans]|uniref:Uncharacterized protein n=1 Tax=Bodo saltans TaxID=75058 RepID=A0A0S4JPX6_BODSA|nr:Hypothetical protein, putative [Bodo saltans]|eukprot:CUG93569.1 Hypothetical protein, putative [Bodo saltans]